MATIERLLNSRHFIRNASLSNRWRTSTDTLISKFPADRAVETLIKDTTHPDGHIYNRVINDSYLGEQQIRLVKTTKPYNPDFMVAAQTLAYLLPHNDFSKRIVTPTDGSVETWMEFMKVNQVCAETLEEYYRQKGMKDFVILIGASFSPYANSDIVRAQNIKATHVHSFLISSKFLKEETVSFATRMEFTQFLQRCNFSSDEISMDARRFFRSRLGDLFNFIMLDRILAELETKKYPDFETKNLQHNKQNPIYGLKLANLRGLDFLSSRDFSDFLKTTSKSIEDVYTELIMPIFINNYEEIKTSADPESVKPLFNSVEKALDLFNRLIKSGEKTSLSKRQIMLCRKIIRLIQPLLNQNNKIKFSLGPAYSFGVLFDSETQMSVIAISYNPFGGGVFEAFGLDKVWFPDESKSYMEERFNNPKSLAIESELFNMIKNRVNELSYQ